MTLGVRQRVEELARREIDASPDDYGLVRHPHGRPPFRSMVSLQQILSEVTGVGINTKRVRTAYMSLIESFGTELTVLLDAPTPDLATALPRYGERLAEGMSKVRAGDIYVRPGFDGQFGLVKVWPDGTEPLDEPVVRQATLSL